MHKITIFSEHILIFSFISPNMLNILEYSFDVRPFNRVPERNSNALRISPFLLTCGSI